MIILLSNDDGIEADGLSALRMAVREAFPAARIFTVAPEGPMSQVGHQVTTTEPLGVEQRDERAWAVRGTPADCVRVALHHLLPEEPDWVFSGVNHGGNMGQDIYISGTVAAAREACYHGVRAAAFSHYLKRGLELQWELAARWVASVMREPVFSRLEAGSLWNVNLPHLEGGEETPPPLAETVPESSPLPVKFEDREGSLHYAGVYAERPHSRGSDVAACFGGHISRTKLRI